MFIKNILQLSGLAFTLSVSATETTLERHVEAFCEDGYAFCPESSLCLSKRNCFLELPSEESSCPSGFSQCDYTANDDNTVSSSLKCCSETCSDTRPVCFVMCREEACADGGQTCTHRLICDKRCQDEEDREKRSSDYESEEEADWDYYAEMELLRLRKQHEARVKRSAAACANGTFLCPLTQSCNSTCACPPPTSFCPLTGNCSSSCGSSSCSSGTQWCAATATCRANCQDDSEISCPPASVFCMKSGRCEATCGGSGDDGRNQQEQQGAAGEVHCARGETFCMASGACERSCVHRPGNGSNSNCFMNGTCTSGSTNNTNPGESGRNNGTNGVGGNSTNSGGNSSCSTSGNCTSGSTNNTSSGGNGLNNSTNGMGGNNTTNSGNSSCSMNGSCTSSNNTIPGGNGNNGISNSTNGANRNCTSNGTCSGGAQNNTNPGGSNNSNGTSGGNSTSCSTNGSCASGSSNGTSSNGNSSSGGGSNSNGACANGNCSSNGGNNNGSGGNSSSDSGWHEFGSGGANWPSGGQDGGGAAPWDQRPGRDVDDSGSAGHDHETVCPPGLVYCMTIDACVVGDCSLFETTGDDDVVVCREGEIFDMVTSSCAPLWEQQSADRTCAPGQVYCMSSATCIPMSSQCGAQESGSDLGCPPRGLVEAAGFSTCMVRQHCATGQLCCTDKGGLSKQCVSVSGRTVRTEAPALALNRTCAVMGQNARTLLNLANETCSGGAAQCRPDTLCCEGTCRGLPRPTAHNQDNNSNCPQGTMFCDVLKTCVALSGWSRCRIHCAASKTPCGDGATTTCQESANCSQPLGRVVLAPRPNYVDGGGRITLATFRLADLLPREETSAAAMGLNANVQRYRVVQVSGDDANKWQVQSSSSATNSSGSNNSNSSWLPLEAQKTDLGLSAVLRLSSALGGQNGGGAALPQMFNFTMRPSSAGGLPFDASEVITVAQTIVPALNPPVISANWSVGGVMVVAAGRSTFRLTDALSVAENASSSAALEAYHRRGRTSPSGT